MGDGVSGSVKVVKSGTLKRLEDMMKKARNPRAFVSSRLLPKYKEYQMQRWATENEGSWPKLSSLSYIAWKKRKYASAIGQGERMMIASGKLLKSVLLEPGGFGRSVISDKKLIIDLSSSEIEYGKYANEARNFTKFDPDWIDEIRGEFLRYMKG